MMYKLNNIQCPREKRLFISVKGLSLKRTNVHVHVRYMSIHRLPLFLCFAGPGSAAMRTFDCAFGQNTAAVGAYDFWR